MFEIGDINTGDIIVPKLTLSPFLTLNVRNGHKSIDLVFGIPAHSRVKVESKTIINILFNMTRTTIPNFKLFKKPKL